VAPSGQNLVGNPILIKPEMALRLDERGVDHRVFDEISHDQLDQTVRGFLGRGLASGVAPGIAMPCCWQYAQIITSIMFERLRRSIAAAMRTACLRAGSIRVVRVSVLVVDIEYPGLRLLFFMADVRIP